MEVAGKYPYGKKFLKATDSRYETAGLPCNLRLFDPTVDADDFGSKNAEGDSVHPLTGIWKLQSYLKQHADHFTKADHISLHIARAVVEYKACGGQGLDALQYLYTMEYKDWSHHFFRDMTTGTIINLVTASQFQSNASFLCLDGGKVLAHLCEKNRPGEKTEAYTGLSLEALLPYIDHHVHLSLSGEYFQIMEFLGEGFESVVFKVHNHLSGGIFALKLGKLALEGNYRLLQPLLPTIKQAGISVPQYVSYDAHVNGILMEYSEGERFASFIEQMEQQKKKRFELFQMYAECLAKLITLQSTFHLSHGDAHEDNWLIAGDVPTLIDFRYSVTIPFTSQIYQYRDVFAMLCMLYRLVYGKHPENRPEVKRAIMQQRTYQTGHLDAFPPFHHGNRYDPLLHQFLRRAVYHPQAFTLQDIAHIVEVYRSGFPSE